MQSDGYNSIRQPAISRNQRNFNETSSQVGKILYAMAVHAVQTRALHMGGVVKVQKIAAVNSWLQRSLSCCVAKARARLFLERLKLVTPTNAPARHRGTSIGSLGYDHWAACGLERCARLPSSHLVVRCSRSSFTGTSAGRGHLSFHPVIYIE